MNSQLIKGFVGNYYVEKSMKIHGVIQYFDLKFNLIFLLLFLHYLLYLHRATICLHVDYNRRDGCELVGSIFYY